MLHSPYLVNQSQNDGTHDGAFQLILGGTKSHLRPIFLLLSLLNQKSEKIFLILVDGTIEMVHVPLFTLCMCDAMDGNLLGIPSENITEL